MTLDERDAIDRVSTRLGQIAATACLLLSADEVTGTLVDVMAGIEAQCRDLADALDAVTDPHSGPKARLPDART